MLDCAVQLESTILQALGASMLKKLKRCSGQNYTDEIILLDKLLIMIDQIYRSTFLMSPLLFFLSVS